jgi:hypothetical protein
MLPARGQYGAMGLVEGNASRQRCITTLNLNPWMVSCTTIGVLGLRFINLGLSRLLEAKGLYCYPKTASVKSGCSNVVVIHPSLSFGSINDASIVYLPSYSYLSCFFRLVFTFHFAVLTC